ncbi:Tudor and KH domain-containing protein homolog [Gryllus bimaculatus]|nr:Tudor and KH domain-containing protein homolog [Gryllus bimaculatus]
MNDVAEGVPGAAVPEGQGRAGSGSSPHSLDAGRRTPADVESALEMIRQKFPEKRYPSVSLEQVCFVAQPPPLPVVPVLPDCLRLPLVEGVTNDVTVSSLVTPAHFFLQQPTHPTFPALARLGACMDATYGEMDTPAVPTVQAGIVVAAPVMGSWYRAEVVAAEEEADSCQVRYVDYGGYEVQQNAALRQIRSDFMTLPFQAVECYLANILCKTDEEEGWSTEALSLMEQMTAGQVLQAQVCGYCEDGVPAVALYAAVGTQVVSIGEELVARGFAQWWEPADG